MLIFINIINTVTNIFVHNFFCMSHYLFRIDLTKEMIILNL